MIDALLAALPDQAYFEQSEFGAQMRDSLRTSKEPYGCSLRGAKLWNLAEHPEYPFYAICKDNSEDNIPFGLYGENTLVLSSAETGELLMLPMRDYSGKIPLLKDPEASPPPRPTHTAKSYSVDDDWRTISAKDLAGGTGGYLAFVHAGNFQSSAFGFQVVAPSGSPPSPFETRLKAHPDSNTKNKSVPGVHFEPIAGLVPPAGGGVVFRAGMPTLHDGSITMRVEGAFRFKGIWKAEWARLPLHVLVATAGDQEPRASLIWLSREKLVFKDGMYSGCFAFDLAGFFLSLTGQKIKPPPSAWMSFVHRDWQGPISRIDFEKR